MCHAVIKRGAAALHYWVYSLRSADWNTKHPKKINSITKLRRLVYIPETSRPLRRAKWLFTSFVSRSFQSLPLALTAPAVVFFSELLDPKDALGQPPPVEVVVNASQPETNISHTSSTSVSPSRFNNPELSSMSFVASAIPGLTASGGSSRPRFFQIRGIGERELFEGIPSNSVATVVDGIDLSGLGALPNLFDVSRVRIHRGPDLFSNGPNAFGGAVEIETMGPILGTAGQEGTSSGQALVSGGTDNFGTAWLQTETNLGQDGDTAVRAVITHDSVNGFRHNEYLSRDDTNQREASSFRLRFKSKISGESTLDASLIHINQNDGYDAFSIFNGYRTQSDRPGVDEQKLFAGSLRLTNAGIGAGTLQNTLASVVSRMNQSFDGDWGNNQFWAPYSPYDYAEDQRRNPIRLSHDIRWISDNFDPLEDGSQQLKFGSYSSVLWEDATYNQFADGQNFNSVNRDYRTWGLSPYAEYSRNVGYDAVLVGGARADFQHLYYSDRRTGDGGMGSNFYTYKPLYSGLLGIRVYDDSVESFNYTYLTRGARIGGINPGLGVPDSRRVFQPESLWNLEAGRRTSWNEGRNVTQVNFFYGLRGDQQVRTSVQSDPNNPLSFAYYTDNAAKGDLYGMEVDNLWKVNSRLTVRALASLMQSNIYDFRSPTREVDGRDQSHSPRWSYDLAADYQITDDLYAGLTSNGKASFYFDDQHDRRSSPYGLLNARIGYNLGKWNLEGWVTNLLNKRYDLRGFYFGNEPPNFPEKEYVQLGDPRVAGVTLRYLFN